MMYVCSAITRDGPVSYCIIALLLTFAVDSNTKKGK